MIKRSEFTIKSQHDGLELGVSLRVPDHPKAILQLVHGMSEYRERYHEFMHYCAEQGYVVIIHDHRGHGASIQNPDDLGYFYRDGANGIISDVHQITLFAKSQFPGLPLAMLGHSMGSLIARCLAQEYDSELSALIICGSPSKRFGASAGRFAVTFLKLLFGERHRSNFVQNLSFAGYNRTSAKLARQNGNTAALGTYISPNSWVVSDPAIVAVYDADPRSGFTFTLNGFAVLFELMSRAYHRGGWLVENPSLPILFISGADDPCLISHKDFDKAVNFMRGRGYTNVASKLYPGMRHEILNERGKLKVWQDVLSFLAQSLAQSR